MFDKINSYHNLKLEITFKVLSQNGKFHLSLLRFELNTLSHRTFEISSYTSIILNQSVGE